MQHVQRCQNLRRKWISKKMGNRRLLGPRGSISSALVGKGKSSPIEGSPAFNSHLQESKTNSIMYEIIQAALEKTSHLNKARSIRNTYIWVHNFIFNSAKSATFIDKFSELKSNYALFNTSKCHFMILSHASNNKTVNALFANKR